MENITTKRLRQHGYDGRCIGSYKSIFYMRPRTLLHCAILYYTNDCAALINMDMMDGTMTSTKVWSICGPESPTASISNGDLKISIRPWKNVTLIMPGNEFSATLSD